MKKAEIKVLQGDEWQLEGDLVLKEGKIYVPKDEELGMEIIWLHHNVSVAGYEGRQKMTKLVTRNYQQPGVTRDIRKYMECCDMYQRMKNRTEAPVGKLIANKVLEKTQTYLIVDFIMKLPLVAGKDVILVVCDRLSKMAHFMTTTETTAEELVRLFRDNIQKLYGLLESVISDRGPQFVAELMKELNKILGIETRLLMVFYPQIDGQIEQMN